MAENDRLNSYIKLVNDELERLLSKCGNSIVAKAMSYSIKNGGKRIRPILTLEFCRLCGGKIEDALEFACALEMIHTYSLIHDDLPCMDNDDMRRGKPSCHIAFGESYALLAGDALLNLAFECSLQSDFAVKHPDRALKALGALSKYSGILGMIGGQTIDLQSEGKTIDEKTLRLMDELKTGALIKAAVSMGVIIGDGNDAQLQKALIFADRLGTAFQVVDDILDVIGSEADLGKPIGSDAQSNKSTYVSLLGLEKSKELATALTDEAIKSLAFFGEDSEFLKQLAISLVARRN